jgi:hypothetical protein
MDKVLKGHATWQDSWISVKGGLEKRVLLCSSAVPLLYVGRRFAQELCIVICHGPTVVFLHGDICLARMGKIVRTGNSSIDSVEIELLEYSPLISLDLSVYYPIQVSLLTPTNLWPSTFSLFLRVHTRTCGLLCRVWCCMHGRTVAKLYCTLDLLMYTTARKIAHMTSKGKFVSVPSTNFQRSQNI